LSILGLRANAQIIDPKTGYLTRDGFNLFESLIQSFNGVGAGVTVDALQTLVNKTIDGDRNTLSNIATNSLSTRTGENNAVVTGEAGAAGSFVVWGDAGDASPGMPPEELVNYLSDFFARGDGQREPPNAIRLLQAAVAEVPSAADLAGGLIYVTDETGGATVAFSDGTNWRRVQDRAVIS
jgi:hypothetical protein